ncbi:N-acetylgalactosamine-6-sulfatase (fragment) [uncultured spirochete]|jgi:arylsulfatase A-like enzyme|uniref:N-acetylgalactosamine-6-sulfatase n=1 Tax=uncultured spirochete TaxID=156406 RepID=A0A3P3XLA8_9SPIR
MKKEIKYPNVIFILCDDFGYGDAGCYGGTSIPTPNIDKLAEQSMRFTQCYAGAPVCAPSRCVLMTGLHTGHCTVRDNFAWKGGLPPEGRVSLRRDDSIIAEDLKHVGYTTGIFGKWGIGEEGTEGIPNLKGFDEWFGYLNQRHAHSYFPTYLWKNQKRIDFSPAKDGQQGPYSHDLIVNYAIDFITRNADKKFFLYLPWCLPHEPYEIPAQYAWNEAKATWKDEEKAYASMVRKIDTDLGRIMELLEKLRITNNTLLFCVM